MTGTPTDDDGHDPDGGNAAGESGVYGAMRTSTASTHPPPRARPVPRPARADAGSTPAGRVPQPSDNGAAGETDGGTGAEIIDLRPGDADGHVPADDGFSTFYRDAWPGVARALAVALGDRDLAVEATDEAMARAYPRWRKLSSYDNPGAWVYRVGLNWARSHRRRLARRPPAVAGRDVDLPPVGDPAVREALLSLPLAQRSVVVCRLLLDWSVEDTAIALGVRPGTVQSRLHRALRSLQDALDHLR